MVDCRVGRGASWLALVVISHIIYYYLGFFIFYFILFYFLLSLYILCKRADMRTGRPVAQTDGRQRGAAGRGRMVGQTDGVAETSRASRTRRTWRRPTKEEAFVIRRATGDDRSIDGAGASGRESTIVGARQIT